MSTPDVIEARVTGPLEFSVRFTDGSVSWPDEIDLASGAIYAAIRRDGAWVLE